MERKPKRTDERPYVGDFVAPLDGPQTVTVSFGMVVLALAIGFVVGFLVWALLRGSAALTNLIWFNALDGTWPWFSPLVICTAGGLVIGLWSKFFGGEPESLEAVLMHVRKTGSYRVKSIAKSTVAFLLPLAFGGSVGPEAGLTGLIASACYWISATLKKAGLKVKAVADVTVSAALSAIFATPLLGIVAAATDALPERDEAPEDGGTPKRDGASEHGKTPDPNDYTFRRGVRLVLYTAAAFGAVAGIMVVGQLTASASGLPRYEMVSITATELIWFAPCLVAGYVLTLVFHGANTLCAAVGRLFGQHVIARAVVCGVVLGLLGIALPFVLFAGEEQSFELMEAWQDMGAMTLIATGLIKAAATPMCLNMGWRGGNMFPVIFAGACTGYGIAQLTGADATFCVTVATAAMLGGVLRKPVVALAVLLLCFPFRSIVWLGLACVIGATIPVPRALLAHGGHGEGGEGAAQGNENKVSAGATRGARDARTAPGARGAQATQAAQATRTAQGDSPKTNRISQR